jgi:hypothetical protein
MPGISIGQIKCHFADETSPHIGLGVDEIIKIADILKIHGGHPGQDCVIVFVSQTFGMGIKYKIIGSLSV